MQLTYQKYLTPLGTQVEYFFDGTRNTCFHGNFFPAETTEQEIIQFGNEVAAPSIMNILRELGWDLSEHGIQVKLLVDPSGQLSQPIQGEPLP